MVWIEEYGDARRLLDLDVDAARGNGDISLLVYALPLRAQLEIRLGRLAAAYADALEGVELAETMGQPFNTAEALVVLAHVEALSGRGADCAVHAKQALALAPHNLAVESRARHAVGLEALVAGRSAAAVDELARADAILRAGGVVEPAAVPVAGDLAEALALAGRGAESAAVVERLAAGAARTARVGQAAVAARVRALLADDASAPAAFEAALAASAAPLDGARTRLRYGQWLRRARKRQRARAQLEAALRAFEAAGAKPWADRAREELSPNAAAGADDSLGLTPHEWRIAYAAAQGRTSRRSRRGCCSRSARSTTTWATSIASSASGPVASWPAGSATVVSRQRCMSSASAGPSGETSASGNTFSSRRSMGALIRSTVR